MKLVPRSFSSCSESVSLLRPIIRTGTLAALYCRMSGGVMPGGSGRSSVCEIALICATPASTFAPGWKKTLITLTPRSVWDSMCWMSLTVVVEARSTMVVMRFCISSGASPP